MHHQTTYSRVQSLTRDYLRGFGHRLNVTFGTTRSSLDFVSTSFDTTVL